MCDWISRIKVKERSRLESKEVTEEEFWHGYIDFIKFNIYFSYIFIKIFLEFKLDIIFLHAIYRQPSVWSASGPRPFARINSNWSNTLHLIYCN